MTALLTEAPGSVEAGAELTDDDFDLDVTVVEGGVSIADLLRMTDDGCGTTCQSACNSCP